MTDVVAQALRALVSSMLASEDDVRAFVKIEGFETVLQAFLSLLQADNGKLAGKDLVVKSTGLIGDFTAIALKPTETATRFRNTLAPTQALVLIVNKRTPDAQSLKDLYTITENTLLSGEGLDCLIKAAFRRYQLKEDERASIVEFVSLFCRAVSRPQLADLARFLVRVDQYLKEGASLSHSFGWSLPEVGLFSHRDLAGLGNKARCTKQLKDNQRARQLGHSALDETEIAKLLNKVDEAFARNAIEPAQRKDGMNAEDKRDVLKEYIRSIAPSEELEKQVLSLDWSEVEGILYRSPKTSRVDLLKQIGVQLAATLSEGTEPIEGATGQVIEDLRNGEVPPSELVYDFVDTNAELIGSSTVRQLKKLVEAKPIEEADLLLGILRSVSELTERHHDVLTDRTRVKITFKQADSKGARDEQTQSKSEAARAFQLLYGGLEARWSNVIWSRLPKLVSLIEERTTGLEDEDEDDNGLEDLVSHSAEFTFSVELEELADDADSDRVSLKWPYRSDSPQALTYQAFEYTSRLPYPILPLYHVQDSSGTISDINLRQPQQSIGGFFYEAEDGFPELETVLRQELPEASSIKIRNVLNALKQAWATYVESALANGLFSTSAELYVDAYELAQQTLRSDLRQQLLIERTYRVFNRLWILAPLDVLDWAVVPLIHPLKILWWLNRARKFGELIGRMCAGRDHGRPVDMGGFRGSLASTYSSSGFPAVLSLFDGRSGVKDLLPADEAEGYEIFREISAERGLAQGLDVGAMNSAEMRQESAKAADEIAVIIGDYLETYPFVTDGLEILLVGCRNVALPTLIVESLNKRRRSANMPQVRMSVTVHSDRGGAPIYARLWQWIKGGEELYATDDDQYFPAVTFQVLECPLESLVREHHKPINGRRDIVILADVLRAKGQRLSIDKVAASSVDTSIPRDRFVPFSPMYRSLPEPYERGNRVRRTLLTPDPLPALAQSFYDAQYMLRESREIGAEVTRFYLEYSLREWEILLQELHAAFNWVVCYDPTIDRFLLEKTVPKSAQVIRYSLGRGVKGQHNLTVSSQGWSQKIVERRLAHRLRYLVSALAEVKPATLEDVSRAMVQIANDISGDIVLRAAGPGAFLNELIGLVLAKENAEQEFRRANPDSILTFVYLDDYRHWFQAKQPDLLMIGVVEEGDTLRLQAQVIEAKCVGENSANREAGDAMRQTLAGLSLFSRALQPGGRFIDADYWYDQLYRALAGNSEVQYSQREQWGRLRKRIEDGNYFLELSGHAWVYVYDGSGGTFGAAQKLDRETPRASDSLDRPLSEHRRGRVALATELLALAERRAVVLSENVRIALREAEASSAVKVTDTGREELSTQEDDRDRKSVGDLPTNTVPSDTSGTSDPAPTGTEVDVPVVLTPSEPDMRPEIIEQARDLNRVLRQFKVDAFPVDPDVVDIGPSVLRYKIRLKPGQKQLALNNAAVDIQRELALHHTPIISSVPGTTYVGLDIPRKERLTLSLVPRLATLGEASIGHLPFVAGKTPSGEDVVKDLATLPHLLVGGTTGSGKTVFLQGILLSFFAAVSVDRFSLLLVDPKRTDFAVFNGLRNLRGGRVINEPEEAIQELRTLTAQDLEERTQLLLDAGVQNILEYNAIRSEHALSPIVVLVDEFADLVDVMPSKPAREAFYTELTRLAQRARSAGIHLILATQRPTADVVKGRLKTNLPARVAFRLPSGRDSQVILDETGAENLLGKGDMLFAQDGQVQRLQGYFATTEEIKSAVAVARHSGTTESPE